MPWNDNANPGPWGSPSGGDDRRDQPRRPGGGGGPRRPGGPDFGAGLEQIANRLRDLMGGSGGQPRGRLLAMVGGGLALAWLASGIYQVGSNELGIVTTFGAYSGRTNPGLNYHLPAPIQSVEKVRFTTLNKTEVGGTPVADAPSEGLMLTGDEQVVDLNFTVTWRVADPSAYLFGIREPEEAVKAAAESAMREIVGKTPLQPILSSGRGVVQRQTADLIQRMLDGWGAGITVVEVQISRANPPSEVVAAFRDVQSAEQDAQSAANEANTYKNRVINEAKGDAARIIQAAQGYREQAVREAEGEASRFNQIYAEYRRAPGVTRDRLYIETMQRILQSSNKVVIDSKGASAPIILPPDVFRPKVAPAAPVPPPQVDAAPAQQPLRRPGQ
jgi:membrane protease subunit HflK